MRETSIIRLHRALIKRTDLVAAMFADCMRSRIAHHVAMEEPNEKFFRVEHGLVYVKLTGPFIANWTMQNRSTAIRAGDRLVKKNIVYKSSGTTIQGNWYAFRHDFIEKSDDFFDKSVKKYLLSTYENREAHGDDPIDAQRTNTPHSIDAQRANSIDAQRTNIDAQRTNIDAQRANDAIYSINTNNTTTTTNGSNEPDAVAGYDFSFFEETQTHYKKESLKLLKKYSDPIELTAEYLEFSPNKRLKGLLKNVLDEYGLEMYVGAVVIAGVKATEHRGTLADFLSSVCKDFKLQLSVASRRQKAAPAPSFAPPDQNQEQEFDFDSSENGKWAARYMNAPK